MKLAPFHPFFYTLIVLSQYMPVSSQVNAFQDEIFWKIRGDGAIVWNLAGEIRLPHGDNMEMSGRKVAGIIHYSVDEHRMVSVRRHIIFPQLRTFIDAGASRWMQYRAYLGHDYGDEMLPAIACGGRNLAPGPLDSVEIRGVLVFHHEPRCGISVERILMPSMHERMFAEIWKLTNTTDSMMFLQIGNVRFTQHQPGEYGDYRTVAFSDAEQEVSLGPGRSYSFGLYFTAYQNDEPEIKCTGADVLADRLAFLDSVSSRLDLVTPDPVLNTLFRFSKIRAAESIYSSSMGLVHSPGGGRYYAGVWANDQAEYSGPFFPYLGYATGNIAALNAYRVFLEHLPEGEGHFWSSFEMNGELTCCGADRGDAAMIAFGATHFAMANGDPMVARELWPLIEWCLDYCDRKRNEAGVVQSDSDEMEGRIATGGANLATSSLYYGALLQAADLARSIDVPAGKVKEYEKKARAMEAAIEDYFGATIDGLETYRYFADHPYLRHWICLPLVMGINTREQGTLEALFTRLWTDNGVRVEFNEELAEPDLFWDRGTLYAFRGAYRAGAADRALEKLRAYSTTRLLGFHVPYVVEAWPEGNMAHLSAESALYCRIFTEGLLGMMPCGLERFETTPRLPSGWDGYALNHIRAFGGDISITVQRTASGKTRLKVINGDELLEDKVLEEGETVRVTLR